MNPNYRKIQAIFARIIESPEYERSLHERATAGKLAPMVEKTMLEYYAGKVKDEIEITHNLAQEIANLPEDAVLARYEALTRRFVELKLATEQAAIQQEIARDALGIARTGTNGVH